jgi:hypothetical protein
MIVSQMRNKTIKKPETYVSGFNSAEKEGFEPPDLLQSTVFKTAALNRSAISPWQKYMLGLFYQKIFLFCYYDVSLTQYW